MSAVRLDRSVAGRLYGGARLQPLATLLVVLLALRAVALAGGVHLKSLPLGANLLVLLVLLLVTAVGATGHAEADDAGLSWRYYAARRFAWTEVEQVALVVRGTGIASVRHTVQVRAGGRWHTVTPACMAGAGRIRFGRELLALAAAHGVAVNDGWT